MEAKWMLRSMGDILGSLLYFGQCSRCGSQFVSTRDRAWVHPARPEKRCERCGPPR